MARAHYVKKAAKSYKDEGIKKGEPYWWWKFRYGSKIRSKTQPKASQLTQSEFLGAIADFEERIAALGKMDDLDEMKSERDSIVEEIRQLGEEQDEKRNNMPDSLQDSDTGQLLEERQQECENMADELDGVDLDLEKEEGESDEDFEERISQAADELSMVAYNGS